MDAPIIRADPNEVIEIGLRELWALVFVCAGAATGPLLRDNPHYVFPSEKVADAVRFAMSEHGFSNPPIGYKSY